MSKKRDHEEGLGSSDALLVSGPREDQLDNALECVKLLGELSGGLLHVHIAYRPQKNGDDVTVYLHHSRVLPYKHYEAPTLLEALQKARDDYDPDWEAKARKRQVRYKTEPPYEKRPELARPSQEGGDPLGRFCLKHQKPWANGGQGFSVCPSCFREKTGL